MESGCSVSRSGGIPSSLQYPGGSSANSQVLRRLSEAKAELRNERLRREATDRVIAELNGGDITVAADGIPTPEFPRLTKQNLATNEQSLRAAARRLKPKPSPDKFAIEKSSKSRMKPPVPRGKAIRPTPNHSKKKVTSAEVWLQRHREASNELRFLFRTWA